MGHTSRASPKEIWGKKRARSHGTANDMSRSHVQKKGNRGEGREKKR